MNLDIFISERKATLKKHPQKKKVEGGRIERKGSLRRFNDDDLKELSLRYKELTEPDFTQKDVEYEQSVRENFLDVASILKGGYSPGHERSYGTELATAQDIAVFRALCSTLAECTRDVKPKEFPAVLGLARLKDSDHYGVGFSGSACKVWKEKWTKNNKPKLDSFSITKDESPFYFAASEAVKSMGNNDAKLFLVDPRLLSDDIDPTANVCGACRAVLAARLHRHELKDGDLSRDWDLNRNPPFARNKIYSEAMVLETTTPFYTSYLAKDPIQTGVDGYYTNIDGVIARNSENTPKRRNSGASLMTSCNICKSERASNATQLEVA